MLFLHHISLAFANITHAMCTQRISTQHIFKYGNFVSEWILFPSLSFWCQVKSQTCLFITCINECETLYFSVPAQCSFTHHFHHFLELENACNSQYFPPFFFVQSIKNYRNWHSSTSNQLCYSMSCCLLLAVNDVFVSPIWFTCTQSVHIHKYASGFECERACCVRSISSAFVICLLPCTHCLRFSIDLNQAIHVSLTAIWLSLAFLKYVYIYVCVCVMRILRNTYSTEQYTV